MKNIVYKTLAGVLSLCLMSSALPVSASEAQQTLIPQNASANTNITTKGNPLHQDFDTFTLCENQETFLTSAPRKVFESITVSDPSVVKVTKIKDGASYTFMVKAKKVGSTHITITYKDNFYEPECYQITVFKNIEASKKNITLKKGDTCTSSVLISSDISKITVKSENPKVATAKLLPKVPHSYRPFEVKAKSIGTTTISFSTNINGRTYTTKIKVKVTKDGELSTVEEVTGKSRALVIGQKYCCNPNIDCSQDAVLMEKLLKKGGYSKVNRLQNATEEQIKQGILDTFKDATENDVSLFCYNGYGENGGYITSFEESCLACYIPPKMLADWLNEIPGKVIVILNSNHSGASIDDHGAKAYINAFREKEINARGNAFKGSKFKVLTSTSSTELNGKDVYYGSFPIALAQAFGYNIKKDRVLKKTPADINHDQKLTVSECRDYLVSFPVMEGGRQSSMCYPENCNFKLFQK